MLLKLLRLPEGESTKKYIIEQPKFDKLKFIAPLNVEVLILRNDNKIKLNIIAETKVERICDRCLADMDSDVKIKRNIYIAQETDINPERENHFLIDEYLDGFDIDEYVYQEMFLAEPYKNLCSDDCKGICPDCGANLNIEDCKCK